jgi:hypothetical protein
MLNANVFTNGEGKVAGSESERESRLSAFQSDDDDDDDDDDDGINQVPHIEHGDSV